MDKMYCIAVDLGAGSGRVIRGTFEGTRMVLEELHRFKNRMRQSRGHLCWDVHYLLNEICQGLKKASKGKDSPSSIGIDTWGVDFVLLDGRSKLLGPAISYRDARTDGMMEKFLEKMDAWSIYKRTGTQFMQINTLFQLFALAQSDPKVLRKAKYMLTIPDYLNFLLTGKKCMEFTNATTTQMLDISRKAWADDLLEQIPLDPAILSEPIEPGTVIGELHPKVQAQTGLGKVPVIAPATHDTGSAVASIPARGTHWAFISSGTWSLMGKEISRPILTRMALAHNFTNEGGVFGTYRFLKNIMGMWLVSGLRKDLPGNLSFQKLEMNARRAHPFKCLIDPTDKRFFNPSSMIRAFKDLLSSTNQPIPRTAGAYVRCALESIALSYRGVLTELEATGSGSIERVHIIGGGCQNRLLNQMTADALDLPVLTGPVEGTAVGNILVQAISLGYLRDLVEGRRVVQSSFNIDKFTPAGSKAWEDAWARFESLRRDSNIRPRH